MKLKLISLAAFVLLQIGGTASAVDIDLDGKWEYGLDRKYAGTALVPGLPVETSEMPEAPLWYRRTISLPAGEWNTAVLELKGARFRPQVYVDGQLLSSREGGMARTCHTLAAPGLASAVRPGRTVCLEIRLASLKETPLEDASYIPGVDQWRSNVASCLWDDVVLHLYRDARVDRALVNYNAAAREAAVSFRVRGSGAAKAVLNIMEGDRVVRTLETEGGEGEHNVMLECGDGIKLWTPEEPNCYKMSIALFDAVGAELSSYSQTVGFREFTAGADKRFHLNGKPYRVRGGSLVWHRWMRDKDSREIGFDKEWIRKNVAQQIKDHGGNYLRFHLGVPPERILDLCDEIGLAVQYEWSFFHGMPASLESLMDQYPEWLDMASRHPSVMLYHPYNETEEDQLVRVWKALDSITVHYPPLVLAERDVTHIHRYWWGMSENLGLYYDNYKQFAQPIMVDEFGGIYLDGNGNFGGYPMLPSAMLRLLGYDNTAAMRLHQQDLAYGKVGEYWRRLGAAGVAAFPIICSWNDGNHWYEGPIAEGRLKNVWSRMTVVWSEKTASLNLWDRDFTPGQKVILPIDLINDSWKDDELDVKVELVDSEGSVISSEEFGLDVEASSSKTVKTWMRMPQTAGDYTFRVTLKNPSEQVKYPVTSEWEVRVVKAAASDRLKDAKVWIPFGEREIRKMARAKGLDMVWCSDKAELLVMGEKSFAKISKAGGAKCSLLEKVENAIDRGASVVLLSAGPRSLGIAYDSSPVDGAALSGAPKLAKGAATFYSIPLIKGLKINFVQATEGESHIHPSSSENAPRLWTGLKHEYTYLWNGLRGGIIVPAWNMEADGVSSDAFLSQWVAHEADPEKIKTGPYFAYEYCGFYAYSDRGDDAEADKFLKDKVAFICEDMPAMQLSLPRNTPTRVTDLHAGYMASQGVEVSELTPLVVAGKNLVRTPVVRVRFDAAGAVADAPDPSVGSAGKGCLVVSQLVTEGRLSKWCAGRSKAYPVKYDEVAVQFVLNLMDEALEK